MEHIIFCQPLKNFHQRLIHFAGSSEMFGKVREVPQTEKTPFYPDQFMEYRRWLVMILQETTERP